MAEMDRQRGERIRQLREAHGWTQRQVADKLGVDPKTVHNWEAGKEANPTNLREFAELVHVSLNFIRFGEQERPDITEMFSQDGAQSQLDRIEAGVAATRVEIGELATQLADLSRSLARRASTSTSGSRSRKAK